MARRYPELSYYKQMTSAELQDLYNEVQIWGSQLITELESRDVEVANSSALRIYQAVTTTDIKRPIGGQIVYAASSGISYTWSEVSSAWRAHYV